MKHETTWGSRSVMESDMGSKEANLFYSLGACIEHCASKPRYNSILAPLRLWCELPQLYTKRSHCRKALTDSAIAFSSCRPWALVNAVRELTADRLVSTEALILKHSSSVLPSHPWISLLDVQVSAVQQSSRILWLEAPGFQNSPFEGRRSWLQWTRKCKEYQYFSGTTSGHREQVHLLDIHPELRPPQL